MRLLEICALLRTGCKRLWMIKKIVCYGSDRFEVEYTFAGELAELMEKGGAGAA